MEKIYTKSSVFLENNILKKNFIFEVELNGKIRIEHLLQAIHEKFGIIYKIKNAELEFYGEIHMGTVKFFLEADENQLKDLENYLNSKKILNVCIHYF